MRLISIHQVYAHLCRRIQIKPRNRKDYNELFALHRMFLELMYPLSIISAFASIICGVFGNPVTTVVVFRNPQRRYGTPQTRSADTLSS